MNEIKQIKDFFQAYNRITENCFKACVNNLNIKTLAADEELCTNNCASKFINSGRKFMLVYQELQPEIMRKRAEEVEAQMKQLMEKQKEIEDQGSKTVEQQDSKAVEQQ